MVVCVFESMAGSELLVMDAWYRVIVDLNLFCDLLLGGGNGLSSMQQTSEEYKGLTYVSRINMFISITSPKQYMCKLLATCKAHNIRVRDKMLTSFSPSE